MYKDMTGVLVTFGFERSYVYLSYYNATWQYLIHL